MWKEVITKLWECGTAMGTMLGVAFVVIVDDKREQSLEQHFAHEMARKESVLMMDGSYHVTTHVQLRWRSRIAKQKTT
jgi:hypothetical protein